MAAVSPRTFAPRGGRSIRLTIRVSFPVRHGSLSMCCSASSGSPETQQAHRRRRCRGRSASRTLATSSAVAREQQQHPLILPRAREIKLFTFARRVIERERSLEKSPTVVDAVNSLA